MKRAILLFLAVVFILGNRFSFAQEPLKPGELTQEIISAKDNRQVYSLLQQAKDPYFKSGKFNEFCAFLNGLVAKKNNLLPVIRYFYSLSRYQQLKYLEEKQSWDEYFNKGNDYRQELTSGLEEVIKDVSPKEPLRLYARLLLWQFHYDQQDVFVEESLAGLFLEGKDYAEDPVDTGVLSDIAEKLYSSGEKGKAKEFYKLYVDKMLNAGLKDEELSGMAEKFYKSGNLELAEIIYDAYIDRIIKAEKKELVVSALNRISRDFAYKDGAVNDPVYAEKIFQKSESFAGKEVFDEQSLYLRAYNLEKTREFSGAKEQYTELLKRFPASNYSDKINFKLGVIYTYVLRDMQNGREFFQKLAGKETANPEVIASLYHLGILAQWEDDLERAKANYLKLKEQSGNEFKSITALAEARLKEVAENKLLDSNIRSFLDVSLRQEYSSFNMAKVELKSSVYNPKKGQEFTMAAVAYPPESGCMPLSLEYVWAGDFGENQPSAENSSFTSFYSESGIKFIGLVVRTQSGIIDRSIDLIDVE